MASKTNATGREKIKVKLIGECDHEVRPIKRDNKMLRWCDTCDRYQLQKKVVKVKVGVK